MKHSCIYLENSWKLYGPDAFEFGIVEECESEKLTEREQYYFDLYGKEKLFNTSLCAEAPARGRKLSDETKQKLRDANLGENNPGYGKSLSDEIKKKIGDSHRGEKNHFYGKTLNEEHKRKIRDSLRGDKCYKAKLTWDIVKKIRDEYENDIKTVSQMSEELSMDKSNIYDIIKGDTWKDDTYTVSEKVLKKLKQGSHIIDEEIAKQIREEYKTSPLQLKELSEKYGLSKSNFGKVVRNQVWEDPEYAAWMKTHIVPNKKPTRINYDIAQQIREDFQKEYGLFNKELGYSKIGERYNLSSITVRKIVKNKMWTTPNKSY
jgi:group I intron endonuclease